MSAPTETETYEPCPGCDRERLVDGDGCMVDHNVYNPTLEIMVPCPGSNMRWDILDWTEAGDDGTD